MGALLALLLLAFRFFKGPSQRIIGTFLFLVLGFFVKVPASDLAPQLRHVKPRAEVRAAEEIANRTRCEDFDTFKPIFKALQKELDNGVRETNKFRKDAGFLKSDIKKGQFFILGGQVAYVASVGEPFKAPNGSTDARLRVIYSNSTESDILLRSLQRALYKDEGSRFISDPSAGPLFSGEHDDEDLASGTIYLLGFPFYMGAKHDPHPVKW